MVTSMSPDDRVIWYCIYISGSLSLAASTFVLLSYALFERLRTPTMRLVLLQSIMHVVLSLSFNVAFYYPPSTGTFTCNLQGFLINFSFVATSMCAALIAGYMMLTATMGHRIALSLRNLSISAAVIVFVSMCMGLMPLLTNQYANLGARCWIAEDEDGRDLRNGVIMRFASHYIPVWISNLFILYACVRLVVYFRATWTAQQQQKQLDLVRNSSDVQGSSTAENGEAGSISIAGFSVRGTDSSRSSVLPASPKSMEKFFILRTMGVLAFYPVICFFVWAPVSTLRVATAVGVEVPLELLAAALVLIGIQGFLYGIVFCKYRSVQEEWGRVFQRLRGRPGRPLGNIMSDTPVTRTDGPKPAGSLLAGSSQRSTDDSSGDGPEARFGTAQPLSHASARHLSGRRHESSGFVARVFGDEFMSTLAEMDMPELSGASFVEGYEDADMRDSEGKETVELRSSMSRKQKPSNAHTTRV